MKYIPKLADIIENHGKRRTLDQLRLMTERQSIDRGYSPELINEGVKAWPWRQPSEKIAPLRFDTICCEVRNKKTQVVVITIDRIVIVAVGENGPPVPHGYAVEQLAV